MGRLQACSMSLEKTCDRFVAADEHVSVGAHVDTPSRGPFVVFDEERRIKRRDLVRVLRIDSGNDATEKRRTSFAVGANGLNVESREPHGPGTCPTADDGLEQRQDLG